MKKFELSILEKYLQDHLIVKQKHPTLDIWIYNYTPECVFSRKWDDITTSCRGLILDGEGNVVAKPFPKFFNYEELERLGITLPEGTPKITKKLDGSLVIATRYKDELIVATRGSFISDQAKLAKELLELLVQNKELYQVVMSIDNQFTYLFELTGPDNRIVVTYPENKLTLLSVITNWNGRELNLDFYRDYHSFSVVEEIKAEWNENTIKYLKDLNLDNEEGFVLKWNNEFRTKIKFEDYIRLHRLVTGLNEKTIWEWIKDGKEIEELVKNVPEEFSDWIFKVSVQIMHNYTETYQKCQRFIFNNNLSNLSRKEAAILIIKNMQEYQAVLFSFLDKRPERVRESIYKLIKPKTNKVFKDNKEEV